MISEAREAPFLYGALGATADVPSGNGWLSPEEIEVQSQIRTPKRHTDWRLGRYVSKRLLQHVFFSDHALHEISVLSSDSGAPRVFLNQLQSDISLSLSHRDGSAFAVCGKRSLEFGCDLEKVEPRTRLFVEDYFTKPEISLFDASNSELHPLVANLVWSAKESVLKAMETGLRIDTRLVEIRLDLENIADASGLSWRTFSAEAKEKKWFGRWFELDGFVYTTASSSAIDVEQLFRLSGGEQIRPVSISY